MQAPPDLERDIAEVLITSEQIQAKVAELGARVSVDYAEREVTLVSVLKGSLPFMADMMRNIRVPLTIDLMEVSSYGGATTETTGLVRILKDLSSSIEGRDVLIVEDIIDTGLTLNYLIRYLNGKNPASLRICTLLDKPARWRVGGSPGLPEVSGNGLSGTGIVVLLAAVLVLALVALPYASGDRPQPLDRPAGFVIATGLGVVGLAISVLQIYESGGVGAFGLPDRSPGLWLG